MRSLKDENAIAGGKDDLKKKYNVFANSEEMMEGSLQSAKNENAIAGDQDYPEKREIVSASSEEFMKEEDSKSAKRETAIIGGQRKAGKNEMISFSARERVEQDGKSRKKTGVFGGDNKDAGWSAWNGNATSTLELGAPRRLES